ncbi:MAG: hypothetical protein EOP45_08785, partial [Sphingobacteriaceae bacterium]
MIEQIVIRLSLYFSIALIIYWCIPGLIGLKRNKRLYQMGFTFLPALFMTGLTLFFFNSPDQITDKQVGAMQLIDQYSPTEKSDAHHFIDSNFIFISNSYDKVLIPYNDLGASEGSVQSITNRQHISELMSWFFINQKFVDLVICDIGFSDTSIYDRNLHLAMVNLT